MTITLLAKKGGVGKSTVCVLLHEAFKKAGKSVAIQDWDAQGTSNKALAFVNGQRAEPNTAYDILLIDTPPSLEHPATAAAVRSADIAIVVTSPAPADLWEAEEAVQWAQKKFGLQDVTEGREIRKAVCTGWRFFLMEGDNPPVAAAELGVDSHSGALRFAGVNAGPHVTSTFTALQARLRDPELQPRDWLVRVLRIPSLYVMALWLRDASSGEDRFWALGPTPKNLEENRMYSRPQFSDALNKLAQIRLATKERDTDKG